MTETHIRQTFRTRRVAGGSLVFISVPLTLIWARFGLPPQGDFSDLILLLGGPGLLLLGLWAAFPMRKPAVRLTIANDALQIHGRNKEVTIAFGDLTQVATTRPLTAKHDRLTFAAAGEETHLDVIQLTHEASDIINLISMRLEMQGKHLREGRTDVMGAPSGVWTVEAGNPFAKST